MRTRKLTPEEVAACIAAIPERDGLPPPIRCQTAPGAVVLRWSRGPRSVYVLHEGTATFVELWEAGAAASSVNVITARARPLVPFLRAALDWLEDGGPTP